MKKVLIVFGTRPEAIKMAPIIKQFQKHPKEVEMKVCVTAQHREMLDQVLDFFEINPDYDLSLMKPNQNLHQLTADILMDLRNVLENFDPDYVMVHGDTTTTMAASLAAFYHGSQIVHIEAGLRTNNLRSPFPEEMNRQVTSKLASLHFAPTAKTRENLLNENIKSDSIWVSGNTVIDALFWSEIKVNNKDYSNNEILLLKKRIDFSKRIILVTGHRRENHNLGIIEICKGLKHIANKYANVEIVYPVHMNPKILKPVHQILSGTDNIKLIEPLTYPSFVWLMNQSYFILTDSGGIQEEAPSLGKPVLLMRDSTERPEAISSGTVLMVGANADKIIEQSSKLLDEEEYYKSFTKKSNPFGNGKAAQFIVEKMLEIL